MAYRHILTVYDGSDDARQLLDMVCRIARPNKARVTILIIRVIPLSEELPTYAPGADPTIDTLVKEAEHLADARGVTAATGVRYARALAAAVVAESRLHGVDFDQLSKVRGWRPDINLVFFITARGQTNRRNQQQ